MADIFISYASENRVKVATLVRLLESAQWSVWWDQEIEGGRKWTHDIEDALGAARCVLVLWSRASIVSDWTLREAEVGLKRNVLLPALLEPVDPPVGFTEIQATRLTAWLGDERSFELRPLLSRVSTLVGGDPPEVDELAVAKAVTEMSRVDVAEATFEFCAARLEFLGRNARQEQIPSEVLERLRLTYDRLAEALSPVTSDQVHQMIDRFEGAFTP